MKLGPVLCKGRLNLEVFFSQVIYYFYAIVGMELFANRIKMFGYPTAGDNTSVWNGTNMFCGTVKLKDTDFFADRYCNNNFNNIVKSMKVLFDLMVVNQWHGILW